MARSSAVIPSSSERIKIAMILLLYVSRGGARRYGPRLALMPKVCLSGDTDSIRNLRNDPRNSHRLPTGHTALGAMPGRRCAIYWQSEDALAAVAREVFGEDSSHV